MENDDYPSIDYLYKNTRVLIQDEICIATELVNGIRIQITWIKHDNQLSCTIPKLQCLLRPYLDHLREKFSQSNLQYNIIDIYANAIGGNVKSYTRDIYGDFQVLVFDIKVNNEFWLGMTEVTGICKSLGLLCVPWAWCWTKMHPSKVEYQNTYYEEKSKGSYDDDGDDRKKYNTTRVITILEFFNQDSEIKFLVGKRHKKYGIVLKNPYNEPTTRPRTIAKFKWPEHNEIANCPFIGECWAHRCLTIDDIITEFITPMRVEHAFYKLYYRLNRQIDINMIQEAVLNDIENEARGEYDLFKIAYEKQLSITQIYKEFREKLDERVEQHFNHSIQEGEMLSMSMSLSSLAL